MEAPPHLSRLQRAGAAVRDRAFLTKAISFGLMRVFSCCQIGVPEPGFSCMLIHR